MDESIVVRLTATGKRSSGKSTVLILASEALRKAGFEVSNIVSYGEEVITESIVVTTVMTTTGTKWLTQQ